MELVSLGLEMVQSVAEHAASYRLGQSVLRQLDRALWVVEKCARWAVPPPLDQDERPPPTLVRPLPWVFFLIMLVTLRVARESISLANLVMGKPPLRSADVVVFIQSKRRYLRTLKYQGNRMMRARTSTPTQQSWYRGLQSLFQLTMCFRRESHNYGNNNTTRVTNNDEVVVIKPNKRGRQESPSASISETTMERLIEKMMVDLDAESDDDSETTLTNSSQKNDRSECMESDQDTICQTSTPVQSRDKEISQTNGDDIHFSPNKNKNSSSTPEKQEKNYSSTPEKQENNDVSDNHTLENNTSNQTFQKSYVEPDSDKTVTENSLTKNSEDKRKLEQNVTESAFTGNSLENNTNSIVEEKSCEDSALPPPPEEKALTPSEETQKFIESEAASHNSRRITKKDHKIGRKLKIWSSTMKNFFQPQANRERSNGKECSHQKERSKSSPERKLKRSASTKSAALKQFVLKSRRTSGSKEVISE